MEDVMVVNRSTLQETKYQGFDSFVLKMVITQLPRVGGLSKKVGTALLKSEKN